jgi:hypothetical protein
MGLMIEYSDRRMWELGGHEVTRLLIDYRFALQVWWLEDAVDHDLILTIGVPFRIRMEGRERLIDPEVTTSLASTLPVLHKRVETLTVFRDGRLVLRFCDGAEIEVEKHAQHESWEAEGSGRLSDVVMLCSPHDGPPWKES